MSFRSLGLLPCLVFSCLSQPEIHDATLTTGPFAADLAPSTRPAAPPDQDLLVRVFGRFGDLAPFAVAVTHWGDIWTLDAMEWSIEAHSGRAVWLPAARRWRVQPYALTPEQIERLSLALSTTDTACPIGATADRPGPLRDVVELDWWLYSGQGGQTVKTQWPLMSPAGPLNDLHAELLELLREAESDWLRTQSAEPSPNGRRGAQVHDHLQNERQHRPDRNASEVDSAHGDTLHP